jgi:hypothetical protein
MKAELRRIWKEAVVGRIVALPLNLRKETLKKTINFSEDNRVPAEILSRHIRNKTSDCYRYVIPQYEIYPVFLSLSITLRNYNLTEFSHFSAPAMSVCGIQFLF